jgi:formiminotetrahydrofolate cyclodeaminase
VTAIAMGVALGTKVIRCSPGGPAELQVVAARLESLLECLIPEFAADCLAFEGLLAALRQPGRESARADAIRAAWQVATEAPLRVARLAAEAADLLSGCGGRVNANLAGDLAAALELVGAGLAIATGNARENAAHLPPDVARRLLARLPAAEGP